MYETEGEIDKVLNELNVVQKTEKEEMCTDHLLNYISLVVRNSKMDSYQKRQIYECLTQLREKTKGGNNNE